jgi:hypothetical protein
LIQFKGRKDGEKEGRKKGRKEIARGAVHLMLQIRKEHQQRKRRPQTVKWELDEAASDP